ncbi:unnamed protein product [Adineta steineri]|uniref:Uncharacterized protein n=1 Tax=Adineta steineri TaxID=433720 RepID=A0A813S6S5_9BILA|nr:unnamed protein product [Adineta steineri]CAF0893024.1 unnamed protein product [Adineta steineri]
MCASEVIKHTRTVVALHQENHLINTFEQFFDHEFKVFAVLQAAIGSFGLSTIQNSDKIIVIDKGQMKEEGTHNELLKLNGIYSKMVNSQNKST